MRQVLLIGLSASLITGAGAIYTGTFETRSECEVVQDTVIACAINIGKNRYVTEIDLKRCRESVDMEMQE